jgi:hypothetical protein
MNPTIHRCESISAAAQDPQTLRVMKNAGGEIQRRKIQLKRGQGVFAIKKISREPSWF